MYTIQDKLIDDIKEFAYYKKKFSEMFKRIDTDARELLSELQKVNCWKLMINECEEHFTMFPHDFFDRCRVEHTDDAVQFIKSYGHDDDYIVLEISLRKPLRDQVRERIDYLKNKYAEQKERDIKELERICEKYGLDVPTATR